MSETAYKAVDNALTSMSYSCGADPLVYTPGASLVAEGLPGTDIDDPINRYRGIQAWPTVDLMVKNSGMHRLGTHPTPRRPEVPYLPWPLRYVELSYELDDVLAVGDASYHGGQTLPELLSLKAVTVVDEIFPPGALVYPPA